MAARIAEDVRKRPIRLHLFSYGHAYGSELSIYIGLRIGGVSSQCRWFLRNSLLRTSMPLLRTTSLVVFFACAVSLTATTASVVQNAKADEMDSSIKPGEDFYRYANGGWLKTVAIPAGQSSYDNRATLMEKTSQRVRDLIQDAAASHPAKGSVAQKV